MDLLVHLAFGISDGDQPINEDMNRTNSSPKRTTIPANRRIVVIVMATQRFDSESVEMRSEKISFPTIFSAISYDCFVVVFSDIKMEEGVVPATKPISRSTRFPSEVSHSTDSPSMIR